MDLESAQESFVRFLGQLQQDCKIGFLEWVCKEYSPSALEPDHMDLLKEETEEPDVLDEIARDLKAVLPLTALSPGEPQFIPDEGSSSEKTTTLHVDSFLYPEEEDIDQLCSQLGISRSYCLHCASWRTAPLNFISHSMSRDEVRYIFGDLLPDLTGKTVVDVGSRLGAAVYEGFLHSKAASPVGIEKNAYFCEIQQRTVTKYNMAGRVKIVCSDVLEQGQLLASADVVVLNYVFEMFRTLEERARIWEFLFSTVRRRGTILITVTSIQDCWKPLPFNTQLELDSWVVEMETGADPSNEDLTNLHLYCVL
ncbi:uncharacterized protein LOC135347460 [Halichondria panicea]|uniref:uncharacterized protein LOC135347460 n=1 Tax=Halichondria panicea TaxID=6063 RepID=UPI00312BA56B